MKSPFLLSALIHLLISSMGHSQVNLVVNGGFDRNDSGWIGTNLTGIAYVPAGGNPPGSFYLSSTVPSKIPAVSQQIKGFSVGSRYIVSGEYRSGGKGFVSNNFGVVLDGVYYFVASSPTDYNWHSYNFEYLASSTNAVLSVAAQLDGKYYPYYIDNLAIQKIPSIEIQFIGSSTSLLWPTNGLQFRLQSATSIAAPNWTDVTVSPVVEGTNYSVSLSASQQSQFFRLTR